MPVKYIPLVGDSPMERQSNQTDSETDSTNDSQTMKSSSNNQWLQFKMFSLNFIISITWSVIFSLWTTFVYLNFNSQFNTFCPKLDNDIKSDLLILLIVTFAFTVSSFFIITSRIYRFLQTIFEALTLASIYVLMNRNVYK